MSTISIVLPVYNGQKYIKQAIESIINQTYKDWELIIINDCSTDNTVKIIEEYTMKEKRIKFFSNEKNLGLPSSLNEGFRRAKGNYFTWTSDDNIFLPEALEKMVSYLMNNTQTGLVYADMEYIDSDGRVIGEQRTNPKDIFLNNCVGACFLYTADVASKIGEYNCNSELVEDYEYWLRIRSCYEIDRIEDILYRYRKHKLSLTETKRTKIEEQLYILRKKMLCEFEEQMSFEVRKELFLRMYLTNIDRRQEILDIFSNDKGILNELKWILTERKCELEKKTVLVGAGKCAREILTHIDKEKVYCFVDNDEKKQGTCICGKKVLPFDVLYNLNNEYQIVITVGESALANIISQLNKNNITDFVTQKEYLFYYGLKK